MHDIMQMVQIAREAGQIMLQAHLEQNEIREKGGHANYVTKYDEMIQHFLFEKLGELVPEAQFLGEEDGQDGFREQFRHGLVFVIDPIDGTTNFVVGMRCSVVAIGLLKDGRPWQGVVCNPYADECFWAEAGQGAFLNGKPIHTSENDLAHSLALIGTSPYNHELKEKTFGLMEYYYEKCIDLRRSGSAEWDLCTIAAGRAGVYFEFSLGLWDYTAGSIILTEAGGKLTDIDGRALTYDRRSSVLACSAGAAAEVYGKVER